MQRRLSVMALLLLCLSGSLWLQGEHIHVNDHGPVHDCLVCQHSAAAACGEAAPSLPMPAAVAGVFPGDTTADYPATLTTPPARGPPV